MTLQPVNTAIIGCGTISSIYLENCTTWDILDVVACANLQLQRAKDQAAKYHVPRAGTVDEMLADPEIELIINLTIPAAHAMVGLAALRAGKSVYKTRNRSLSAATTLDGWWTRHRQHGRRHYGSRSTTCAARSNVH